MDAAHRGFVGYLFDHPFGFYAGAGGIRPAVPFVFAFAGGRSRFRPVQPLQNIAGYPNCFDDPSHFAGYTDTDQSLRGMGDPNAERDTRHRECLRCTRAAAHGARNGDQQRGSAECVRA